MHPVTHQLSRLTSVLVVQLALTWFCPPIPLSGFTLFPSDLAFFIWVPVFWLWGTPAKNWRIPLLILITFGVIWIHGASRPLLWKALVTTGLDQLQKDDFKPVKEAYMSLRFTSWLIAGTLVARAFSAAAPSDKKKALHRLCISHSILMSIAAFSLILAKLSPTVTTFLENAYAYRIADAHHWHDRVYGIFRAPVEAGTTLAMSIAILPIQQLSRRLPVRLGLAVLGMIAVALSKTLTPAVAAMAGLFVYALSETRRETKRLYLVLLGLICLSLVAGWMLFPTFFTAKWVDLIYRLSPWRVYFETAMSRWDLMLLGVGFTDYHVDNSYIFLFNRGGLLLFGLAAWILGGAVLRQWKHWLPTQRGAVAFLLVNCFVFDTLISRPNVALLIAVWIPLLANRSASSKL